MRPKGIPNPTEHGLKVLLAVSSLWSISGLLPSVASCVLLRKKNRTCSKCFNKLELRQPCPGGGMAYAGDLKSLALRGVWVRLPLRAPTRSSIGARIRGSRALRVNFRNGRKKNHFTYKSRVCDLSVDCRPGQIG